MGTWQGLARDLLAYLRTCYGHAAHMGTATWKRRISLWRISNRGPRRAGGRAVKNPQAVGPPCLVSRRFWQRVEHSEPSRTTKNPLFRRVCFKGRARIVGWLGILRCDSPTDPPLPPSADSVTLGALAWTHNGPTRPHKPSGDLRPDLLNW